MSEWRREHLGFFHVQLIDVQRAMADAFVVVVVDVGKASKHRECHASEGICVRLHHQLQALSPSNARQVATSRFDLLAASRHRGEGVGYADRDVELSSAAAEVGVFVWYYQVVLC